MAIVINSSPSGQPSVHDNLWHIVSSTNSGQVDFKYVFDIFVNGVQKIRVKQFLNPIMDGLTSMPGLRSATK